MDSGRFFELNGISHYALMFKFDDTVVWRKVDAPPKKTRKMTFSCPVNFGI